MAEDGTEYSRELDVPSTREPVVKHLLSVEGEVSFDNPEIIAVIATSPEMLLEMLQTGRLRDRSPQFPHEPHEVVGRPTRVSPDELTSFGIKPDTNTSVTTDQQQKGFMVAQARRAARVHYLIESLGLPYDPQLLKIVDLYQGEHNSIRGDHYRAAAGTDALNTTDFQIGAIDSSSEIFPYLPPDMSPEKLAEIMREAELRQGFLIGVGVNAGATAGRIVDSVYPQLKYDKEVVYTFPTDKGNVAEGMPYRAIVAIEPTWVHSKSNAKDFLDQFRMGVLPA